MVSFDCQFDVIWIHLGDMSGNVCVVYSGDLSENEDLAWCGWYKPVNLNLGWGKKGEWSKSYIIIHLLPFPNRTQCDESCFVLTAFLHHDCFDLLKLGTKTNFSVLKLFFLDICYFLHGFEAAVRILAHFIIFLPYPAAVYYGKPRTVQKHNAKHDNFQSINM